MKRIFFENDQKFEANEYLVWLSTALCFFAAFKPIENLPNWIYSSGLFLSTLYLMFFTNSLFRYRHHVFYDDRKITLHLNSLFGKTIRYDAVKSFTFGQDYLEFDFNGGSIESFELKNIDPEYLKKLNQILLDKINRQDAENTQRPQS